MSITNMDFNLELNFRLDRIVKWLEENKIGSTNAKVISIAQEMFWCNHRHKIEPCDVDFIQDKLRTVAFEITEGDLWEKLGQYFEGNDKYVEYFKDISELTPVGLNTSPNACCGKNELLWRLLRPKSSQPTKGDILDDGVKYELKGKGGVRISDTVLTGKDYNKNCKDVFETKITGNMVKTGGLKQTYAYEIEKHQHKKHYETEFGKNISESKSLILQYFETNGWSITEAELELIFQGDVWHQDVMNKISLSKMFNKYKAHCGFDKMYIFGDGTNVKILSTIDDLEKVQIHSDYFRINQTGNVGWYVI